MTDTSLRVVRTVSASAHRLFHAWTDPDQLAAWWSMDEPGWAFAGASVDLRVGGRYRLSMTAPDGTTHTATGVYRQVDPPRRLVFTWDWEREVSEVSRVGATVVTVEFRDRGEGSTEVVVTHEAFLDPARVAGHERGWSQVLHRLERLVDNGAEHEERG